MKVQNPTKLDIFFKGGGIIKFPVQNLKQIDIEPIDEQGDGGSENNNFDIDRFKEAFVDVNNYVGEFAYQNLTVDKIKIPDAFIKLIYTDENFNNIMLEDTDIYEYLTAYTLKHNNFFIIALYKIEDEFDNDDVIFGPNYSTINEDALFITFNEFSQSFEDIVYDGELNLSNYKLSFGG